MFSIIFITLVILLISLISPLIMIFKFSNLLIWTITSIIFILILLIGLDHE